ncbi:MAG: alpha-ketoacid dehydrogenase subunit beta [Chloroflexota bacterium]|nr:alpha-ketoacid dehydrogenase subunit beta [Chloroflexota bacterium]
MTRMTFAEALVGAIAREMRRDPDVFLIGQDIGPFGGAMQGTRGLFEEFGPRRIRDAPISESAMVGAAIGAALQGKRPIVEVSFGEFLPCAMNQIVLQAANLRYMTAGATRVPVVIRTRVGDGPYRGHPQSYEAWFAHVPGLKVVMPATPADASGLMTAAIRDDDPVMIFEQMFLYHAIRDDVPDGDHVTPIGVARVAREGRDVTIAATAWMVHRSLEVARTLRDEGIDAEVIDLRTLAPLDADTLLTSVRKTGRLVVAHEAWKVGGIGAEVAAVVAEGAFDALEAPIARVGAPSIPVPSATALRNMTIPSAEKIADAVRSVVRGSALSAAR